MPRAFFVDFSIRFLLISTGRELAPCPWIKLPVPVRQITKPAMALNTIIFDVFESFAYFIRLRPYRSQGVFQATGIHFRIFDKLPKGICIRFANGILRDALAQPFQIIFSQQEGLRFGRLVLSFSGTLPTRL